MFKQNKNDPHMVIFSKNFASGGVAGALTLCFIYSLDNARTRLANDVRRTKRGGGERKYNGLVDVYRKTIATDGIAGLHRGFVSSCVNIIIYRGCYFGFYDTLKPILLGPDAGIALSFLLGYGVAITSGLLVYPLNTIRRRIMMTSGQAVKYKGPLDCMFQTVLPPFEVQKAEKKL
jgi:solute carrier family 25 (adenine nucleotide translocator) protein 4/5/6/31